ncbi:hypothetical protein I33_2665 [Bacillus subtilis subsp. subtilis str. RO-NN-1]|nr:hypothetical protein I33_2665 [Bacillus subtilis subsp. subtilis str. RO-NN-1]
MNRLDLYRFSSPFFNHISYKRIEMVQSEYTECNENKLS